MQDSLFDFPKMEINKSIRLITLFSGIGSQEMALRDIGADFEIWKVVEFDKYAIKAYNAIHGTNFTTTDIRDVHGVDLGIKNRDKFTYLLTYSFPCFTGDTLVLSKKGYKQFSELKVGDVVLTKSNTWHPIVKKFDNGVHKTCYINSFSFKNLHCTLNHEFYVREMYRKYPRYQNGKRGNERHFKEPVFKQAKDLTRKDYFGIPVIQEEKSFYTDDLDFWYMLGFYIGDGWLSTTKNEIKLACNDIKLEKLKKHLDIAKWNYTVNDLKLSCHKLRFMNKEVYEFIGKYVGTGSTIKHIPGEVLLLPKEQLSAFFEGYCDSDGNTNASGKHDYIRITSVNKNLIYSTSMIVNKLYHRPVSINVDKPRLKKHLIDGREIKQNYPVYEMKFKLSDDKQDKAFYENGYIWFPFYELKEADFESVYNIEVEDDHSYIAQGCISKNCTDLSVAGKMQGMSKADWENGNSTRSGLLWEVERILKELPDDELPQVLLMENVPQVHAEKNRADFEAWLSFLRSKGYHNFWDDLNAKNYGIPQNRDRCFCVSVLSDDFIDFEFPEPIKLEKVMKDFLEDEVDEKYYINDEKSQKLIAQLIESGVLPTEQNRTEQNRTEQNRTDCKTVDLCVKSPREISVANCIKARYDAGISNLQADGSGVVVRTGQTV